MSDLDSLITELGSLPARVADNVGTALEVAARGLKDDWIEEAEAANPSHAARYPRAISYDIRIDPDGITAEVGPTLGGQGSLAIIEEAPGSVAAAPQRNWEGPLRAAEKDLERGIDKAIGGLL